MKKTQIQKRPFTSEKTSKKIPVKELAASVSKGRVDIYGLSLEEVCQRHRQTINKTASYDLRAIEQGKYAIFMWSQISNFSPGRRQEALNHIIVLLESAIDTLTRLENREKSKYRHIIDDFRRHFEIVRYF